LTVDEYQRRAQGSREQEYSCILEERNCSLKSSQYVVWKEKQEVRKEEGTESN
jgi:hypothetical protein